MVVKIKEMIPLSSLSPPDGNIQFTQPLTTVYVDNVSVGIGTLYVAESVFQWINSTSGLGFAITYPRISVHAISRDLNSFPEECLFLLVEKEQQEFENGPSVDDTHEDQVDIEIRVVPQDKQVLSDLFDSISFCQTLHPDPVSVLSDDDDEWEVENDDDDDEDELVGGPNGLTNGHSNEDHQEMDLDDNIEP